MRYKVYTYGKLHTSVQHMWPAVSAVDVCDDNPPFHVLHRWYQFSWLGLTLNVNVPSSNVGRAWFFETRKIAEWLTHVVS